MSDGSVVELAPTPEPMPNDIGHFAAAWKLAYDDGKMDGFDRVKGAFSASGQNLAYTQMRGYQIPNYWAYAKTYGLGDHMFADWKGVSFGNNLFEVAAQAGGFDASLGYRSAYGLPESPTLSANQMDYWGCDDPPDTTVVMLGPNGGQTRMFPCFNFPALPNTLSDFGISWAYYADEGTKTFAHNGLDALQPVRNNPALWANVKPTADFFSDLQNGQLPAVSWLLGRATEHPVQTACAGENQTVSYVNAIMHNPAWSSTAIIVVWDEWGGFYDHVPPPQVDRVSYGFRVPLLVISPYTKVGTSRDGGYVSHTFYSFGSLLKFVEDNWNKIGRASCRERV